MQISPGECDFVLIHDAARPNISSQLCSEIVNFSTKSGNSVIGTKVSDTLKDVRNGIIKRTVDREHLYCVQTPQVFKYSELERAYKKRKSGNTYTDESSLVESAGFKVSIFPGSIKNIKLTTIDDLNLLKNIMK